MNLFFRTALQLACILATLSSIARADMLEWEPRSLFGNYPDYLGFGHTMALTDDGGRVEVVTEARVTIPSNERYANITKFDASGMAQWSQNLNTRDAAALRVKQGGGIDRDIYVLCTTTDSRPG